MQAQQSKRVARPSKRASVLSAIGALVALPLIVIGSVGAAGQTQGPHANASSAVAVSPAGGGPTQVFTVSFTVDTAVTGNNWYLVEVKARSKKRSCEYHEAVQISNAGVGQRISAELRPYDRGRWCIGRYSGTVRYYKRISCRSPDTNESVCFDDSGTTRFRFRVTR